MTDLNVIGGTNSRVGLVLVLGGTQSRRTTLLLLLAPVFYFIYFVAVGKGGINDADAFERLSWSDAKPELVALRVLHQSVHYGLGTDDWNTLLPSGQHIVYVDDDEGTAKPHSVTLFHQLRCLEVLQREYADDTRQMPSALGTHCFNYLRQLVLCQMDLRAEAEYQTARREGQEAICHDWTAVYEQAEQNYASYSSRA